MNTLTSSNPISNKHSTAPLTGKSRVEKVVFPIRIDLYFSSLGFLIKKKVWLYITIYNFHHVFTFFLHLTLAMFPQFSRDPDLTDSRCGGTPWSGDSSLRAHLAQHHCLPPQLITLMLPGGKYMQLSISVLLKLETSMSFLAAKKKKRRKKTHASSRREESFACFVLMDLNHQE